MCGIAGIVSLKDKVELHQLKKMTDAIAHRGPDGEGQWVNNSGQAGLGHRRLSIIDLSQGASQPMHSADGRYSIVFNGEIYNYIELKQQLEKEGCVFKTRSDTEVLLKLYETRKKDFLHELDGMFAFAIWDNAEQTLFCARDRFGEKPFFYVYEPGKVFYFASEMKAFWALGIPKIPDPRRVKLYIDTYDVLDQHDLSSTFYKNINQLDASHFLLLDKQLNIEKRKYFSIDIHKVNYKITEREAADVFRSLLTESVRLRLRSDVPVGSSLSGGLDSSSIVMLIDALKGNITNQNTFSARFEGFVKDEGKYIHSVVNACKNVTCHEVWPKSDDMVREFETMSYHQEEPIHVPSVFVQWKVMELAKQKNVTVLLDGQGADEYLAGYISFYEKYLRHIFYTHHSVYKKEWTAYRDLRGEALPRLDKEETLKMKLGRIKRTVLNQPGLYDKNSFRDLLLGQTLTNGLKTLLRYADRNSMAHSREVRLPFLSHKLVEFTFSLPEHFKLKNGWTKLVLRNAMENILPKEITWRIDKVAFEPPKDDWMQDSNVRANIKHSFEKCSDLYGNELAKKASDWHLFSLFYQ